MKPVNRSYDEATAVNAIRVSDIYVLGGVCENAIL
jgi:hypothetical protein